MALASSGLLAETAAMADYEHVLTFWFGELDEHGLADEATRKRWWTKSKKFDDEVRTAFEEDHRAIVAGEREDWLTTPRGRLAYVIVLDQLSRNMFRDSAKMYAADEQVQRVVLDGLERGDDRKLRTNEQVFFYMPLMHSEELAHQDRCCELFDKLSEECPEGLRIEHVELLKPQAAKARPLRVEYRIPLPAARTKAVQSSIQKLRTQKSYLVERKGRDKPLDMMADLDQLDIVDGNLRIRQRVTARASVQPREILAALELSDLESTGVWLSRTAIEWQT